MQQLTSKELLINMRPEDVPKWNTKKDYFDQELTTLDFWDEEFKKIKYGVNIGGYKFHPWLYFHINFFNTPIPTIINGVEEEEIMRPPLSDNILYAIESYQEAEQQNLGVCFFGCRGSTKSTLLASLCTWLATTKTNGTTSLTGGSSEDLKAISSLIQTGMEFIHPSLYVPKIRKDWEHQITLGYKTKSNRDKVHSTISITNTNKGKGKGEEKGAGLSPVGYILDEIGKQDNFSDPLLTALPSFMTPNGAKLVHTLAGTGGNQKLSRDAQKVLSDPEGYKLLLTNYDKLERTVPEEMITWDQERGKKFVTFFPGQMSYRLKGKKKEMPLSDYIGNDHKDLTNIPIQVTDWANAKNNVNSFVNSFKDASDRDKQRMYYPFKISDCFLTQGYNPFPKDIIKRHIEYLKQKGDVGKDVEVYNSEGTNKMDISDKRRPDLFHKGGVADAPVIVHGEFPQTPTPKNTNIAGLDGYKLDQAEVGSLGSLYVVRRRNLSPNTPTEVPLASYTARPDTQSLFNENCLKVLQCYGAMCCMESVDLSFKTYLEERAMADQWLTPAIDVSTITSHTKYSGNSKFGFYPSKGNNDYRLNLSVQHAKEQHTIGQDEEGNPIIKYGVEFIEDIDLLEEMLHYSDSGNFDRITAWSHALVYCRYLDNKGTLPKVELTEDQRYALEMQRLKAKAKMQNKGKYGTRRNLKKY